MFEGPAECFLACVYGAMLAARVFGEPVRFKRLAGDALRSLSAGPEA